MIQVYSLFAFVLCVCDDFFEFIFLLSIQSEREMDQVIKSIVGMAMIAFVSLPPRKPYQS